MYKRQIFKCLEARGQPLIYDNGTYVVPHDNGLCAVGSTTEKEWREPSLPDYERSDFIERAKVLCPALHNAKMIGRWAGVRPRCNLTDPVVGRIAGNRPVLVATGGYKITFGIVHRLARIIAAEICDTQPAFEIPPTFQPNYHFTSIDA